MDVPFWKDTPPRLLSHGDLAFRRIPPPPPPVAVANWFVAPSAAGVLVELGIREDKAENSSRDALRRPLPAGLIIIALLLLILLVLLLLWLKADRLEMWGDNGDMKVS